MLNPPHTAVQPAARLLAFLSVLPLSVTVDTAMLSLISIIKITKNVLKLLVQCMF